MALGLGRSATWRCGRPPGLLRYLDEHPAKPGWAEPGRRADRADGRRAVVGCRWIPHAHVCCESAGAHAQNPPQPGAHRTQREASCRLPCSGPLIRTYDRMGGRPCAAGSSSRCGLWRPDRVPAQEAVLCPGGPSVPASRPCAACCGRWGIWKRLAAVPGRQRLSPGSGGPGRWPGAAAQPGSLLEPATAPRCGRSTKRPRAG